jgi:hypothetical protein
MFAKLFLVISFLSLSTAINAQILIQKIPDENLCEIDMNLLQNGYKLAYSNMTSEYYLFKGREEEWKNYWTTLMFALNDIMKKKGLHFNTNNTCYNRIYFNQDGTIAAYLYHIKGLTAEQEKKFDEYIFQFLVAQKVTLSSNQKYWQYGTIKFQ